MSSNLDRKCRPVAFNHDKSSSDDSFKNHDPFKSSDNENDADYKPSPKKARVDGKLPSNTSKRHSKRANKLSPQERLKRLKEKFDGKRSSTKNTAAAMQAHSSNQIEIVIQNNENCNIENKSGTANGLESQKSKPFVKAAPSFENHDHLFGTEDILTYVNNSSSNGISNNCSFKRDTDNRLESQKAETVVETGPFCANHDIPFDAEDVSQGCGVKNGSENAVLNLVLGLRNDMYEMMNNFKLLSKQVSRLEMKTLRGPVVNNCEYEMAVSPELLLNFDDALAKEGLPITTCVELNQFEVKLKQDPKFREKLVRFFIFIDYFVLFASFLT